MELTSSRVVDIVALVGILVMILVWYFIFPYKLWPALVLFFLAIFLFRSSRKRKKAEEDLLKEDAGWEGDWGA